MDEGPAAKMVANLAVMWEGQMVVQMAKYLGERMAACSAVLSADETVCVLVEVSGASLAVTKVACWAAKTVAQLVGQMAERLVERMAASSA